MGREIYSCIFMYRERGVEREGEREREREREADEARACSLEKDRHPEGDYTEWRSVVECSKIQAVKRYTPRTHKYAYAHTRYNYWCTQTHIFTHMNTLHSHNVTTDSNKHKCTQIHAVTVPRHIHTQTKVNRITNTYLIYIYFVCVQIYVQLNNFR